jgi:glutaryl-CoA dehydrogenase (non-decarboxylating)
LTFDNFAIPAENLIGQEGDGFKICMRHLNHTRLGCAAGAIGLAKAAREAAVNYAISASSSVRRSASFK